VMLSSRASRTAATMDAAITNVDANLSLAKDLAKELSELAKQQYEALQSRLTSACPAKRRPPMTRGGCASVKFAVCWRSFVRSGAEVDSPFAPMSDAEQMDRVAGCDDPKIVGGFCARSKTGTWA
jgi:hypothetical protein